MGHLIYALSILVGHYYVAAQVPMIRGVNLGGWLVTEAWITPGLYEKANEGVERTWDNRYTVVDEYTWRSQPGGNYNRSHLLIEHWNSWVTQEILAELKGAGITHIRIPVGYWYWNFNEWDEPFGVDSTYYYIALNLLKTCVNEWAKDLGLKVLIDLHTAPGSQNGFDNSGRRGNIGIVNDDNLDRWLAASQAMVPWLVNNLDSDVLWGVEVLNEPMGVYSDVFSAVKNTINPKGYQNVRQSSSDLAVVFQTAFRGFDSQDTYYEPDYANVWFDDHHYQAFGNTWNDITVQDNGWAIHLSKACNTSSKYANAPIWSFVGEWSLAITDCTKYLAGGMNGGCSSDEVMSDEGCPYKGTPASSTCNYYYKNASYLDASYKEFLSTFARAQMDSYERANGWFFWNFRTENGHAPAWDYLLGLREGWMPANASARVPYCYGSNGNEGWSGEQTWTEENQNDGNSGNSENSGICGNGGMCDGIPCFYDPSCFYGGVCCNATGRMDGGCRFCGLGLCPDCA